ncbi:MAG: NYN domain-containing protein [Anaerolineaceae bacterium]|nr:NYN domain-containing protein [Anaerolineaceae bacterium]MDE0327716.1 NYN domain-containing protein [Anaerolineaceae bacterium]
MARLAIFIDGGYLSTLAQQADVWVDFEKFPHLVRDTVAIGTEEPLDISRTYYYDCLPYKSRPTTNEENRRYEKKHQFFEWLEELPRYVVRQGQLKYRGLSSEGKKIFEQKGVDLLLGLDFTQLCTKRQITHAAVVTGDSDFLPAIELARSEGIQVWLFYGSQSFANEIRRAADERVEIDRAFLQRVERKRRATR